MSKEAATVSDVKAKVGKDKAALVAEENKELLEEERAMLTSVVGKDTAGVVSKFLCAKFYCSVPPPVV